MLQNIKRQGHLPAPAGSHQRADSTHLSHIICQTHGHGGESARSRAQKRTHLHKQSVNMHTHTFIERRRSSLNDFLNPEREELNAKAAGKL